MIKQVLQLGLEPPNLLYIVQSRKVCSGPNIPFLTLSLVVYLIYSSLLSMICDQSNVYAKQILTLYRSI